MVINSYRPFWSVVLGLWPSMLPIVVYVLAVSAADLQYHLDYNFPVSVLTVLGTVIGLLLAFRTNSSYDRWWEARILWGAIVNDSRTWVRQLIEFSQPDSSNAGSAVQSMAYRQIAWCYALSRSLRKQNPTQDLETLVAEQERETYESSQQVPNLILLSQANELRQLYDTNQLELFQFVELEKTLTRLTDSMGGCERIKNTTFPTSYSRLVHALIYVFVAFLPFGLVKVPAIGLIATSLTPAFSFLLIERVSIYLQDPFSDRPSDTPMLTLSRTIEINIKEMLGEEELPAPPTPKNGVLN
jgi:putative membrane protein